MAKEAKVSGGFESLSLRQFVLSANPKVRYLASNSPKKHKLFHQSRQIRALFVNLPDRLDGLIVFNWLQISI